MVSNSDLMRFKPGPLGFFALQKCLLIVFFINFSIGIRYHFNVDFIKIFGVEHDKILLLSTLFPTITLLGKNCWYNVIVFYVGNKRCCIVLYLSTWSVWSNIKNWHTLHSPVIPRFCFRCISATGNTSAALRPFHWCQRPLWNMTNMLQTTSMVRSWSWKGAWVLTLLDQSLFYTVAD